MYYCHQVAGFGGRVLIPVNVPVTFGNNNQQITANTNIGSKCWK
jgi:hypothetical protein